MKRIVTSMTLAATSLALVMATASPASAAYTTSDFGRYEVEGGATAGVLTWYNQSVGIKGYVVDSARQVGGSSVIFDFYTSNYGEGYIDTQTRTARDETVSFNFTQDGPVGGIEYVDITICSPKGCNGPVTIPRKR